MFFLILPDEREVNNWSTAWRVWEKKVALIKVIKKKCNMLCLSIEQLVQGLTWWNITLAPSQPNFCHTKNCFFQLLAEKVKYYCPLKGLKKKNTWIPACPSWATSSHMLLTPSHFLLTLGNNFVQRRKEGDMGERIINVPSLKYI